MKGAVWPWSLENFKPSCGNNKMLYNGKTNGHGTLGDGRSSEQQRERDTWLHRSQLRE